MSEISAQQQLPFFGEFLAIEQIGPDLVKLTFEELADLWVAVTKFGPHLLQQRMDFAFRKSHDSRADFDGALVAHEAKRPGKHARAVRTQGDVGAFEVDGFHGMIGATKRAR